MGTSQKVAEERRAKFAQGICAGLNQREAARQAGYKGSDQALDVTASKAMRHPWVQAKLAELRERADDAAVATRDELLQGLTADWRRDLGPYMRFNEAGAYAGLDLARLRADGKAHWIEEIEAIDVNLGTAKEPIPAQRVKVKLASRHGAADRLAKLLGLNAPEKHQHQHEYPGIGTKPPEEMTPAELDAEIAQLRAQTANSKRQTANGKDQGPKAKE